MNPSHVRAEHPSLRDYLHQHLSGEQRSFLGIVSFSQWLFSIAAFCDVAVQSQMDGNSVTVALWSNKTPLKDTGWTTQNWVARLTGSQTRDSRARKALKAAGLPHSSFVKPPIRRWSDRELPDFPTPIHRSQIRQLTYHGAPMGRAILQVHPDNDTPINDSHVWPRDWVIASARSYAWVFDQTCALIDERKLTVILSYNGRFLHDRAVADAAASRGVPVLFYDSGGSQTDFDLTAAETHDWHDLQKRMRFAYETWPTADRDEIGASWFSDRAKHADPELALFVEAQELGLRVELPRADTLVAFFSSSGDEIVELDLSWEDYFGSQEVALATLSEECRNLPGTALVVRTHPHMRVKPRVDLLNWTTAVEAAAPDLHLGPDSPADSYELVKQADIIVTYGSTVGVEAAFTGKPVLVLGPNAYTELGAGVQVKTVAQLRSFLANPPKQDPAHALPYGLVMKRRGFCFSWVSLDSDGLPTLAGVRLDDSSSLSQKISDFLNKRRLARLLRK